MKKISLQTIFLILISAFIFGLLIWGIFFIIETDNKISIISIAGILLAAMASVLTVSFNNKQIKERELELKLLNEKKEVFSKFYEYYFSIFDPEKKVESKQSNKNNENKITKKDIQNLKLFHEFKRGLINWGSEKVIEEFYEFIDFFEQNKNENPHVTLAAAEKFLRAIRKELNFEVSGNVSFAAITLDKPSRDTLKKELKIQN